MTTQSLTLNEAVGQLRPYLTDDFLRAWRRVTLALGYRTVGKAVAALAPKATPKPKMPYNLAPTPSAKTVEIAQGMGPDSAESYVAYLTPEPFGVYLIEKPKSLSIFVRAYLPCADHGDIAEESRKLYEVQPSSGRCIEDRIHETLRQCKECQALTQRNARLIARQETERKLPAIPANNWPWLYQLAKKHIDDRTDAYDFFQPGIGWEKNWDRYWERQLVHWQENVAQWAGA